MDPYFVNLGDDSIHNFSFEGTEHDGFVFDGIKHKTSARLDNACSDIINCRYSNNKTIPVKQKKDIWDTCVTIFTEKSQISNFLLDLLSRACSLHLSEQLLFDCVQKVWSKVSWMQENLMLQRDLL